MNKTNMYQVTDTHTHKAVAEGFATREDAKGKRDELNGSKPNGLLTPDYIVSRGTDHPNGQSDGTSAQQRGKNSYIYS